MIVDAIIFKLINLDKQTKMSYYLTNFNNFKKFKIILIKLKKSK